VTVRRLCPGGLLLACVDTSPMIGINLGLGLLRPIVVGGVRTVGRG